MSNLLEIFGSIENQEDGATPEQIVSMNYGINKKTGEKFAKATLEDGHSIIRTISNSGIVRDQSISIPAYSGKEERNVVIQELRTQNFTQDEIASFMGISQATVSNVLKEGKK